ncbi:hypothetical protein [Sporolactobacillus pectinivorans]|uniref:hypothetical protein n=1 Tax=Sporolactobacillus pectinivorans TaxID=1591408 RepID=UPI001EFD1F51|nr:hypothetical protein [Sporolactobacillus pectinivorans]
MTERQRTIGGFFSFELPIREEYHQRALHLNSARYCLEYLLCVKNYKKIYLPAYICDSMLQPVRRLNVDYAFYRIGEDFAPIFNTVPEDDTCLLYINYFGLNGANVRKICHNLKNVIIDNTQAFFDQALANTDTIYSPRKFFGVPDGGYLYTGADKRLNLKQDASYYRCDALLKQIDMGSAAAAALFNENEAYLDRCGLQTMSRLTQRLMMSIDYPQVMTKRNQNFLFLHGQMSQFNQLEMAFSDLSGPMCYPFLTDCGEQLKEFLMEHGIYVNDYWEEVMARVPADSFEYRLAKDLVPLPVDQRYNEADMETMVQIVQDFLN